MDANLFASNPANDIKCNLNLNRCTTQQITYSKALFSSVLNIAFALWNKSFNGNRSNGNAETAVYSRVLQFKVTNSLYQLYQALVSGKINDLFLVVISKNINYNAAVGRFLPLSTPFQSKLKTFTWTWCVKKFQYQIKFQHSMRLISWTETWRNHNDHLEINFAENK